MIIIQVLLLCSCSANSKKVVTSWGQYNYSFWEVLTLKRRAKKNDSESAYKLGMYYYLIEKNNKISQYYFNIAAENDYTPAIKEVIVYKSLLGTEESTVIINKYILRLKVLAIDENLPEDYYIKKLNLEDIE
ncbi:hypothetical protein H0R92_10875 [Treponema sp. OMZ 840]|uniref:hypothetical protein n=1 Tax=Treponema sp. OMZ 840 TaxID=244313 RepID=UPI003D8A389A